MGIHNFHKWIKQNSSCVELIKNPIEAEHVYIDINFCLHNVVYNTKNTDILLKKLSTFIENMLKNIIPVKSITLATDGPAPYAKLMLQRLRRQNIARSLDKDISSNEVNPICFTPGTKFMLDFNQNIVDIINKLKVKYDVTIHELLEGPNEAELKIINQLIKNNIKYPLDEHIIISNDADICIMSSILDCYDKINIAVKSKGLMECFNIKKFTNIINANNINKKNVDLSFIFLLMGNDYLPKLSYISFDNLLKSYNAAYKKNKKNLINHDLTININFFKDLMLFLNFNFKNKGWLNIFSIMDFNTNLYENYIEGLLWCIDCYKNGVCNKYDYMYEFNESPHPIGVYYYLMFNGTIKIPTPNPEPIPDYIYALIVLPKKAKNLIDPKYHDIMEHNLSYLYEEETCQFCTKMYNDLSDLNKTIKYMITVEQNPEKIQEQITAISKNLAIHKSTHKNITFKDIKNTINLLIKNNIK